MTWLAADAALGEFGNSIGLETLTLPETGAVELALGPDDVVALERAGDELLIYHRRRNPYLDDQTVEEALRACHPRRSRGHSVQVAQHGDDLVFVARLPSRDVTLATISSAIARLSALHDFSA